MVSFYGPTGRRPLPPRWELFFRRSLAPRLRSLLPAAEFIFPPRGRIFERGRPDELIALGGRYRELYDLQSSPAETRPLRERAAEE